MSVIAGVRDTMIAPGDKLRWKIRQTKVKRHWPGKAPEWADDVVDDDGDIRMGREVIAQEKACSHNEEILDVARNDDPRLRRLSRLDNLKERRADRWLIRQAENVPIEEEVNRTQEDVEVEDEDAFKGRKRIRERWLQREQEEATLVPEEEEEEAEEEEEEETEEETDLKEEQTGRSMIKPVFVPKAERDTIAERERLEAKERAHEEAAKRRVEQRKVETRQIVVEEIQKSEQIYRNMELEANITDEDTGDEVNETEECKTREIERIKRDREAREAKIKEKEETEKLRNMTEEERREWERKNPKLAPPPKQKRRFMQKYYHRGAFFQDDPDDPAATVGVDKIYHRDFSAPTGEDKMDKTILPKVMQVKHFGRSGRTKWTHLVNEDTTDWNSPWTFNDALRAKYNSKIAGANAVIAKPKGSKKLKVTEC